MIEDLSVRILVLDDEPFMLKLLGRMLAAMGFVSVVTFESGQAALERIDGPGGHPDLILLDINMPEMDGVEFVRYLVERRYAGSIILISGEDERMMQSIERLVQAHAISILGHVQKPVSPERLSELIGKRSAPLTDKAPAGGKVYGANELSAAIANGELINYYQPNVSVATGAMMGVETLVRWRHPLDGIVYPEQFIHVAEAHGLIDDLTQVVLLNALAQIRVWQEAGITQTLRVAVNVSMKNLTSLWFADTVAKQTAAAGVLPQNIILEVTESSLMQDMRTPLEVLTRLRLKGFRLSIDDFGTGHSSLSQLRDIPFNELKIDQGFVHGAHANETLRAIFDASLNLAKELNMEVVTEGVEDADDWDFLRKTNCNFAQGYFIAKPMPAADLQKWIQSWEVRMKDYYPAINSGGGLP